MWCEAFWTAEPHQVTLPQLTSLTQITEGTNLSRPESHSKNTEQTEKCSTLCQQNVLVLHFMMTSWQVTNINPNKYVWIL
jgi:hypothetical protein